MFNALNAMMGMMYLSATTQTPIDSTAWQSVIDAITAQISVSTVVGVLATAAAACIALVFMWWGVRKVAQVVMSAFRNGTVSL